MTDWLSALAGSIGGEMLSERLAESIGRKIGLSPRTIYAISSRIGLPVGSFIYAGALQGMKAGLTSALAGFLGQEAGFNLRELLRHKQGLLYRLSPSILGGLAALMAYRWWKRRNQE